MFAFYDQMQTLAHVSEPEFTRDPEYSQVVLFTQLKSQLNKIIDKLICKFRKRLE